MVQKQPQIDIRAARIIRPGELEEDIAKSKRLAELDKRRQEIDKSREQFLKANAAEHSKNVGTLLEQAQKRNDGNVRYHILETQDHIYIVDTRAPDEDHKPKEGTVVFSPRCLVLDKHYNFYGVGAALGHANVPQQTEPAIGLLDRKDMEKMAKMGLKPLPTGRLGAKERDEDPTAENLVILIKRDLPQGKSDDGMLALRPDEAHIHVSGPVTGSWCVNFSLRSSTTRIATIDALRPIEQNLEHVLELEPELLPDVIVRDKAKRRGPGGKDVWVDLPPRKRTPAEKLQAVIQDFKKIAESTKRGD